MASTPARIIRLIVFFIFIFSLNILSSLNSFGKSFYSIGSARRGILLSISKILDSTYIVTHNERLVNENSLFFEIFSTLFFRFK